MSAPWIDAEEIAREAGDLAEVYVMPTNDLSWEFSRLMAEGTQVYGGAGRVYPVGREWISDLSLSPLRFAWSQHDGARATQHLISDVLRMAASAGLLQSTPKRLLRPVDGSVTLIVAGRALVDVGNPMPATIAEELVVDGVAVERLVVIGQRISGWYDAETNRVDITGMLRGATAALASYSVGDVVLARVDAVTGDTAELVLYPRTTSAPVSATVGVADVTSNPFDDLRTLLTVGEVVAARVVATTPRWELILHDVDDDEPVREAPSLVSGGPPWLVEDSEDLVEAEESTPLPPPQVATAVPPDRDAEISDVAVVTPPPSPRPGPASVITSTPIEQPKQSTRALLLKIDGLSAEVRRVEREAARLRSELLAASNEREQLRYVLDHAERRANRAEHELRSARSRLRKSGATKTAASDAESVRFADREQGFRYLVLTQWAMRTIPSELDGIKEKKVADVVFEIVTGRARAIEGREVHRLRSGMGGEDPVRTREDGAVAWRASLQINTPSARRIHYWILPSGQIELARVAKHDDFSI